MKVLIHFGNALKDPSGEILTIHLLVNGKKLKKIIIMAIYTTVNLAVTHGKHSERLTVFVNL